MPLTGVVHNGKIELDAGMALPEGTRVAVVPEPATDVGPPALLGLLELAGQLDDLPPDFAAGHDHYIHGTPRRRPQGDAWPPGQCGGNRYFRFGEERL